MKKIKKFLMYFTAISHPKNWYLCFKYPFLKAYNVWHRSFCGYSFTEADIIREVGRGWFKAFGSQMIEEIKEAIIQDEKDLIACKKGQYKEPKTFKSLKNRILLKKGCKHFMFYDIKEKWGALVLSAQCGPNARKVLEKYEDMSINYCQYCGKPSQYCSSGWITYLCSDCFDIAKKTIRETMGEKDYLAFKRKQKITNQKK